MNVFLHSSILFEFGQLLKHKTPLFSTKPPVQCHGEFFPRMVLGVFLQKVNHELALPSMLMKANCNLSQDETLCTSKNFSTRANSTLLVQGFNSPSSSISNLILCLDWSSLLSSPFTELSPLSDILSPFLNSCSNSFMSRMLPFSPLMSVFRPLISVFIFAINLPCSLVTFSKAMVLCSILTSFFFYPAGRTNLFWTKKNTPKDKPRTQILLNNLCIIAYALYIQNIHKENDYSFYTRLFLSTKLNSKNITPFTKPVGLYLKTTNHNNCTNHTNRTNRYLTNH